MKGSSSGRSGEDPERADFGIQGVPADEDPATIAERVFAQLMQADEQSQADAPLPPASHPADAAGRSAEAGTWVREANTLVRTTLAALDCIAEVVDGTKAEICELRRDLERELATTNARVSEATKRAADDLLAQRALVRSLSATNERLTALEHLVSGRGRADVRVSENGAVEGTMSKSEKEDQRSRQPPTKGSSEVTLGTGDAPERALSAGGAETPGPIPGTVVQVARTTSGARR